MLLSSTFRTLGPADTPRRRRLALLVVLGVLALPGASPAQERVVTLREAVDLALRNSPQAVAAEVGTDNAEVALRQSLGAFLPSFNLGSNYANSSNQRFDQATGQLVSQNYSAQATGSLELFSFGRRFAERRAAGARLESAIAQQTDQEFAVALATTQLFYEVAANAELVRVAEQRLERARAQLDFARVRLELGTVTRSDVLRAELELGNAELALLDAGVARTTSALRLGRQIGEAGEVRADTSALPASAPPLPELERLVGVAVDAAPPVQSARANVRDQEAQSWSALTRYAPSLRVSGGYDWFAFDFPPSNQSWSYRLTLTLPVFDGFAREATLWRNQAQRRLAEARYDDAVLGARVEVEDAYRRIEAAERRVEISERGLELAREDLRVQEERYQLGAATILDLQTSQVALADAENAWVLERQNLGIAVAQLEAVLGRSIEDVSR
jgi:outer membrane protein TolC